MKMINLGHPRMVLALMTLAASAVLAVSADQKPAPDSGRAVTVTGHILRARPAEGRLVVQTTDGKEMELRLDPQSELKLHQQRASVSQLKAGDRVRVTYRPVDGNNRVVSLEDAPVTAEELRREMHTVFETAKAYSFHQKEEYQRKLEPVLRDLDDRIEHLKQQAKGVGREARKRSDEAIQELQRERDAVRQQLARVRAAAPGAWEEVKAGMGVAWEDLRKAFQRAHDRLKEGDPSDKP
ncbi:MAG TPA: hypothetical protein VKU02_23905 [Gemmataceae bacterium]|nr:hypothetical protein [Gemmataceae bacterium]